MAPNAAVKTGTKAGKKAMETKSVKKDIEKKDANRRGRSDEGMVALEDAEKIDETTRYEGKVEFFDRRRGFGFIKLDQDGLVPKNEVMVVWKEIQSSDRWPFLNKDMAVEFNIQKFIKKNNAGAFLKAKEVTLPGGAAVELQEEQEDKREYVGGDKNLRYEGTVVWFDYKKGFGYVKIADGYDVPEDMGDEIRVHREQVSCGDNMSPHLKDGTAVEFGISKNAKGKYAAFNLTLPGGDPITMASFLNREEVSPAKVYTGKIRSFLGGFGWIEVDDAASIPAAVQKKLKDATEKRSKRSGSDKDEWVYVYRADVKTDTFVDRGQKCKFTLHTSDKGVGASDVEIMS